MVWVFPEHPRGYHQDLPCPGLIKLLLRPYFPSQVAGHSPLCFRAASFMLSPVGSTILSTQGNVSTLYLPPTSGFIHVGMEVPGVRQTSC